MKKKNVLRNLLNENKPSIGTHVLSPWPGVIEVIGHSGIIDYVEFVGEYAPYDLHSLENIGRAVDLFGHMSAMMKIEQQPRTYLAIRSVGSGIQNLLFADIRNPQDAREAVASKTADMPNVNGVAGAGMRRDVGYGVGSTDEEYVEALEDTVVALMIEKQSAIDQLEEILSVDGVDMVQFGPADYAMNLGIPGQYDHPKVKEAEEYIFETAMKLGVAPRVELETFAEADSYLKRGIKHFCIGTDILAVYEWCRTHGGDLAKALGRSDDSLKRIHGYGVKTIKE